MKKFLKVLIFILLVLLIALAGFAYHYRDDIIPLFTSPDKLIQREVKSGNDLKDEINKYVDVPIRDFTDEEKEQIKEHKTTANEVIAKILAERKVKNGSKPTANSITLKYSSKLYEMQSRYTGKIEGIVAAAKADYISQVKSGTSSAAAKANIISKYSGQLYGLQAACDAEFESAMKSLDSELSGIGADKSIIKTMRESYNQAKGSKISYYMSLYKK